MLEERSILLVEDDLVDSMTIKRAFREINVTNQLDVVVNGEEALEYLNANIDNLPCMVLLDLNMPKMNGIEFLNIIKKDDNLKDLNVIVITTSQEEKDKIQTFDLRVDGYIVKPVDYLEFVEMLKTIALDKRLIEEE